MIGVDGRGRGFEVLTDSATLISSLAVYHQRHREDRGRREKGEGWVFGGGEEKEE